MVLREAITNVVRHSGAGHCRIRLEAEGDRALLTVRDDGRGGRASGAERGLRGSGLRGMEERLSELGGSLRIVGDDGWVIEARLPCNRSRLASESASREAASEPGGSVRLAGEGRA
jgi:two-component system sensor histidine kinase DesK